MFPRHASSRASKWYKWSREISSTWQEERDMTCVDLLALLVPSLWMLREISSGAPHTHRAGAVRTAAPVGPEDPRAKFPAPATHPFVSLGGVAGRGSAGERPGYARRSGRGHARLLILNNAAGST